MNLYIVERTDCPGYEECVSILCTAETPYKAIRLKTRWSYGSNGYLKREFLKARKVGISAIYDTPQILMESWGQA